MSPNPLSQTVYDGNDQETKKEDSEALFIFKSKCKKKLRDFTYYKGVSLEPVISTVCPAFSCPIHFACDVFSQTLPSPRDEAWKQRAYLGKPAEFINIEILNY